MDDRRSGSKARTPTPSSTGSVVAAGSRVVLRPPQETDRGAWGRLVAVSRDFLGRWVDLPDPVTDPRGDTWLDATLEAVGDPRYEKLLVTLRDGADLLGALNLNEIVRGKFQSAYLGYWIGAPHAGQGYMTEALDLGLHHAFEAMGLHRVEANIQPDNEASKALVRRAGFVREGYSERYLHIGGQWRDHERFAMTVERWSELRSRASSR